MSFITRVDQKTSEILIEVGLYQPYIILGWVYPTLIIISDVIYTEEEKTYNYWKQFVIDLDENFLVFYSAPEFAYIYKPTLFWF